LWVRAVAPSTPEQQRELIYTSEPDTDDGERLALAVVLGTQSLVG
jgi:hypothetical protein